MMNRPFPYCLIGVDVKPIFTEMQNSAPYFLDISTSSPFRAEFDGRSQRDFNDALFNRIQPQSGAAWSVGAYLEDRSVILTDYPQMIEQKRFYHLGLDINFPVGTPVHTPLNCEVVRSEYEEGAGNYGGLVVLRCQENGTTFYILIGHLERASLPEIGKRFNAGEQIARIGDFEDNGEWYHHVHVQVLTEKAYAEGWVSKGYCTLEDIPTISEYVPNPLVFLFA